MVYAILKKGRELRYANLPSITMVYNQDILYKVI